MKNSERNQTHARTTFTLFADFTKELGGEQMKQAFLRDRGMFEKAHKFETPLTEEQYQLGLKELRAKLPALRYLLQSRIDSV
jgi:hypothetical protein